MTHGFMLSTFGAILLGSVALLFAFDPALAKGEQFKAGLYERITKSPQFLQGGREWGLLEITTSDSRFAEFRLEATLNPEATDVGSRTRTGVVEGARMKIRGSEGTYRSSDKDDQYLGTCVLNFLSKGSDVVLIQSGKCWWFGQDVNASGTYRRTNKRPEDIPFLK